MDTLRDLLKWGLRKQRLASASLRELSDATGGAVSKDTWRKHLKGDGGRPTEPVIRAWSELLDIPPGDLRAAAELPSGDARTYIPPPEADRLSPRQRAAVDELIRSIVSIVVASSPATSSEAHFKSHRRQFCDTNISPVAADEEHRPGEVIGEDPPTTP